MASVLHQASGCLWIVFKSKLPIGYTRQMVGMIAGAWARGQKDRRGRSSPLSLPLRLKIMKAHVEPILTTFCRSRSWTQAQLRQVRRAQAYALRRAFGVDRLSMQNASSGRVGNPSMSLSAERAGNGWVTWLG